MGKGLVCDGIAKFPLTEGKMRGLIGPVDLGRSLVYIEPKFRVRLPLG